MSKPNKMPSGHSPVPIVPIPQNHEELFTGVATQSHTVYPESLFMMGFVWHLPSPIPESASASACARPDPLHIGLAETERSQSGNRPYTVVLYFYRDYTMYYTLMYIYIYYIPLDSHGILHHLARLAASNAKKHGDPRRSSHGMGEIEQAICQSVEGPRLGRHYYRDVVPLVGCT